MRCTQIRSIVDGLKSTEADITFETYDATTPEGGRKVAEYRLGDHGAVALGTNGAVAWRRPGHDFGRTEILEGVNTLRDRR